MTLQTIDAVRDYWNARPCNIRHSQFPTDTLEYHFEVQDRKYFVEPHIPGFAEFGKWTRKKVLEIGCGIGTDAINFAQAGAEVTAIDLSEESLKVARKRAELVEVDIDFWRVNGEDFIGTPAAHTGPYDLIYAFGSIHHSPSPEKILDQIRPYIRKSGTLKIMVYNKYSWKSLWILLKYGHGQFWKFKELVARYSEAQTGCPVTHVYSRRELRAMLERNGFHVKKISVDHIFPYDIDAYKRHEYKLAAPWKYFPDKFRFWLEKKIGWHLLAEATV
jgi:2-polyprenyl-3-methyl-5-hydroxy-6-metoxy-1,4-benzoquinol methylase